MRKTFLREGIANNNRDRWSNLGGVLALAGVAGPFIVFFAEFLVLMSVADYNPVRDSISSLAWSGIGWVQSVTFFTAGLLLEGFAAILSLGMNRARGFTTGIILLAFSGFSLILIGAFRTDAPYFPSILSGTIQGNTFVLPFYTIYQSTVYGTIHGIAAKLVFLSLPTASLLIAPSLYKDPRWRPLFIYSIINAAISFACAGILILSIPERFGWFGLNERILAFNELVWIEVMAIWLCREFPKQIGGKGQVEAVVNEVNLTP